MAEIYELEDFIGTSPDLEAKIMAEAIAESKAHCVIQITRGETETPEGPVSSPSS